MRSTMVSMRVVGAICALALAAAWPAAAQQPAAAQPATAAGVKTAGEVYKNLQVLQGIPSDQLIPTMRVFSGALGVRCQFCHVDGDNTSDMKPEKKTARMMISMMMDINKTNFNGRQQVVCYTCHAGSNNPANLPLLPTTEVLPPDQRPKMPAVDDILSKYVDAIGGEAAIRKVTSRVITGTQDVPTGVQGDRTTIPAQLEIDRKAPNMVRETLKSANATTADGFDGTTAWAQDGKGVVTDVAGPYQARTKRSADLFEGVDLKQEYTMMNVRGIQKVNGHDAYQVIANVQGDQAERLFFDTQTGLLLRKVTLIPTAGGNMPAQVDYDDYRDTGSGVKIPFTIHMIPMSTGNSLATEATIHIDKVQDNVAVDNAKLMKPASKPAAAPAQ